VKKEDGGGVKKDWGMVSGECESLKLTSHTEEEKKWGIQQEIKGNSSGVTLQEELFSELGPTQHRSQHDGDRGGKGDEGWTTSENLHLHVTKKKTVRRKRGKAQV